MQTAHKAFVWINAPKGMQHTLFCTGLFRIGMGALFGCLACMVTPPQAHAIDFTIGEVQIFIDTTASYGVSMRVQDEDCTNVAPVNGGCFFGPQLPDFGNPIPGGGTNSLGLAIPAGGLPTGSRSLNTDDGTQNFAAGDLVNALARVSNDFEIRWDRFSIFVRTLAFYDSIYDRNDLDFRNLSPEARDDIGSDFWLLDAFVTGQFDVGPVPLTLRVGNQAINWGESLFIRGGINSYLPVDVARLRAPGSEVKDGLFPVPAIYASAGVLPAVEIQGFYQWNFVETEVDPAQSFYSQADFGGDGGQFILFGGADDLATSPIVQNRFRDTGRRDQAWGVGLSYYADWLNQGTELQFYYVNFTSHLPYLTFQAPSLNFEQICDSLIGNPNPALIIPGGYDGGPDSCSSDPLTFAPRAFGVSASLTQYGFDFPDNIELIGFSFNTQLFGTALSGEMAYFPDLPLQLTDSEINGRIIDNDTSSGLTAGELLRAPLLLQAYTELGGAGAIPAAQAAIASETGRRYAVGQSSRGVGDIFEAFVPADAITGQLSTVSVFAGAHWLPNLLAADQSVLVLNAGFMWVPDLPDLSESVVNAPGCELGHPVLTTSLTLSSGTSAATDLQCASRFSAGYRSVFTTTYNNVINTAWSVSPSIALRKDVTGRSPGPYGPGFVAGQGSLSTGITADLQDRWRFGVQYLNFFGSGVRNAQNDRDTISASMSVSF
ncbi:MAG: DUF1302 domain-containing protein [Alphaproteobacteria bacterium]